MLLYRSWQKATPRSICNVNDRVLSALRPPSCAFESIVFAPRPAKPVREAGRVVATVIAAVVTIAVIEEGASCSNSAQRSGTKSTPLRASNDAGKREQAWRTSGGPRPTPASLSRCQAALYGALLGPVSPASKKHANLALEPRPSRPQAAPKQRPRAHSPPGTGGTHSTTVGQHNTRRKAPPALQTQKRVFWHQKKSGFRKVN
jgi:hypothetical protein